MQNIFLSDKAPSDYKEKNDSHFPKAPDRCPFSDCRLPIEMKKHGFYQRYVISHDFSGYIYIRRYICPCCGRTISFLPSFVTPYFQYALPYILTFLRGFFQMEKSLRHYVYWFRTKYDDFSRRHFRYYLTRLFQNRKLIQYALNLRDQGMIQLEDAPSSQAFAKEFLEKAFEVSPHYFSYRFFNLTGKSILAPV